MNARPTVMVCAHSPDEVGLVKPVLENAGCVTDYVYRRTDGYRPAAFDKSSHVGLIILGDGVADADDESEYGTEMAWVCAAVKTGKAVLGICHGAQLLAHLYCGKLLTQPLLVKHLREYGLRGLELTEDGEKDQVLCHVKEAQMPQWHDYRFEVPRVAVELARSTDSSRPHSEAFRIGRNVYGLQFHPEPTLQMLQRRGKDEWNLNQSEAVVSERTGRAVLSAWVEIALASSG